MPVLQSVDAGAVEVDGDLDRRLLRRRGCAWRSGSSPATRTEGVEEAIVLGGRADRDPQAVVEPRPARAVAHEHAAVDEALPHVMSRPTRARTGTARSWPRSGTTSTGSRRERIDEPLALGDDRLDPGVHLVDVAEGQPPGEPAWRRRGGTAGRPSPGWRRPTPGPTA